MQNENRRNSYDALSIPSYETPPVSSESSHHSQDDQQVNREMVIDLKCDPLFYGIEKKGGVPMTFNAPTPNVSLAGDLHEHSEHELSVAETVNEIETVLVQVMIVYANGDINCALHFLAKSLNSPFKPQAVGTVLVEESIRDEFLHRLREKMRPLSHRISCHPRYCQTLLNLAKMDVETVVANQEQVPSLSASPIVVLDCLHENLGGYPSGVMAMWTFRNTIEAVHQLHRHKLYYQTASVWNESVQELYQLVASLSCTTFFFNCYNVDLAPISSAQAENRVDVRISDGFHYETISIGENVKIVVFPVTSHLAQKVEEPGMQMLSPILMLTE